RTVGGTLLLGAQCEVALARGEPGQALELATELIGQAARREGPPSVVPRLLKLRGHALVALGRFEEGVLARTGGCHSAPAPLEAVTAFSLAHRAAGARLCPQPNEPDGVDEPKGPVGSSSRSPHASRGD